MFGRATTTLGISPHSSLFMLYQLNDRCVVVLELTYAQLYEMLLLEKFTYWLAELLKRPPRTLKIAWLYDRPNATSCSSQVKIYFL